MAIVRQDPHPRLYAVAFETRFPAPLGELGPAPWASQLQDPRTSASFSSDDRTRAEIRDMLRHGGYKPTGRGKPASEYLHRGESLPTINLAVDACNLVSYRSGIPISVVDLELGTAPWTIAVVQEDVSYVFNRSGQEIALQGLLCLHDAMGPCANAVKDGMRTKTRELTTCTLTVLWGATSLRDETEAAFEMYRDLLTQCGATVQRWETQISG